MKPSNVLSASSHSLSRCTVALLVLMVVGYTPSLRAQSQGGDEARQSLLVTPRIVISERYTSNALLATTGPQNELITIASPGISIRSNSGRLKGSFDYSLNGVYHARGTSSDEFQNALSTTVRLEAVDNWAFLDFSGNISQQAISALGTQSRDAFNTNSNSTETSTFRLSPYLRGRFAGNLGYEARLNWLSTTADSSAASDIRTRGASLKLNGTPSGPLQWGLDLNRDRSDYSRGRDIQADQLQGRLTYVVNPQVNVFLLAGRESNNYSSVDKQSYATSGLGLNWVFTERTRLALQAEQRSFGHSHNLSFEHRTARTQWKIVDSQNVTNTPSQSGTAAIGTLADLLLNQLASLEPDPLRRAELVSNLLRANGLNPNQMVLSDFLASSVSLQRRQEISFALTGIRDTISFSLSRNSNSKLDSVVSTLDDFANSALIRQTGFVATYTHKLTPDAALSVAASRQNTSASAGIAGNSLRAFDVILSSRLGKQLFASFGARRVFFDSISTPYSETAFTGNLNVQF